MRRVRDADARRFTETASTPARFSRPRAVVAVAIRSDFLLEPATAHLTASGPDLVVAPAFSTSAQTPTAERSGRGPGSFATSERVVHDDHTSSKR
jgi:hypothetical protein